MISFINSICYSRSSTIWTSHKSLGNLNLGDFKLHTYSFVVQITWTGQIINIIKEIFVKITWPVQKPRTYARDRVIVRA